MVLLVKGVFRAMAVIGASRQLPLIEKKRIQPRVDKDVLRLAKSKAAAQDITLEYAIEQLLRAWVTGKVKLLENNKKV